MKLYLKPEIETLIIYTDFISTKLQKRKKKFWTNNYCSPNRCNNRRSSGNAFGKRSKNLNK